MEHSSRLEAALLTLSPSARNLILHAGNSLLFESKQSIFSNNGYLDLDGYLDLSELQIFCTVTDIR